MRHALLLIGALLFMLGGCATGQVRHLASDASLIKPGQSTVKDVLLYLGEPDGHRTVSPGVEEYVYYENRRSNLSRTPVVGKWVGAEGYEMIVITLEEDLVTSCVFRTYSKKDRSWAEDFTWEDKQ